MKTKKEELKEYHDSLMLGDKLEWFFRVTGIKWLVKKINPNCNCDERQDMLNEFKFKRK
jgi:hypothetical protein